MIIGGRFPTPVILEAVEPSATERERIAHEEAAHTRNLHCFERNSQHLREEHAGQFICIANEEIFVGDDAKTVYAEASAKYPTQRGSFFTIRLSSHRGPHIYAYQR